MALPLIALQYHEVKIVINFSTAASIQANAAANLSVGETKLWADYIYLDTDERRRFAQVSHEYLIEQVQVQSIGQTMTNYSINFNHPVKEIIISGTGKTDGATTGSGPSTPMPFYTDGNNIRRELLL